MPETGAEFDNVQDEYSLEKEEPVEDIEVPFEPSKIDIVVKPMSIGSLLSRLENNELDLTPDFQRQANLWDMKRKSRLIESVLLRIPLPSFYFSENSEGMYSVVDGLQRLCTLFHFMSHEELNRVTRPVPTLGPFRLSDLQYLKELESKSFNDLERPFQRRLTELEITANVIRANTPPAVKFNVFARLNQGGMPLNAQEIRNAIYPGAWRLKLRDMANSVEFLSATEGKIKTNRQEDVELILRFVALWQLGAPFKRPLNQRLLDDFLNEQVHDELTNWSDEHWFNVERVFKRVLSCAIDIFGDHAFRKSIGSKARSPINRGLFEAELLALSSLSDADINILKQRKHQLHEKLKEELKWFKSLGQAVASNTGSSESSNKRVEEFFRIFREVISAE